MAITRHETRVQWSSSDSHTLTANTEQTSDSFTLDATCIAWSMTIKADGPATPASDDYVNFYLIASCGDPDGTGTHEFDTEENEHMMPLLTLDTSVAEDTTNDIVIGSAHDLPISIQEGKLHAEGNHADSTTNSITISAVITEIRAA